MEKTITTIGILGFGNVGRGVLKAVEQASDMEMGAIFTRRPKAVREELGPGTFVFEPESAFQHQGGRINVMILCGGSKEDLPTQGPKFAKRFNTVDSFDTHKNIPDYFEKMSILSKEAGKVSVISAGWDPGIFSLQRVLGDAFLPENKNYTFWGRGVSQGHSDAVRKIKGVVDARQYTIPVTESVEMVKKGETPVFTKGRMHKRLVYVVIAEGEDKKRIEKEIVTMPNYFDEYPTEVVFISSEEMKADHNSYPHGGFVFTSGKTGDNKEILEFSCSLESNPEFTGSVLVACARAAAKLNKQGEKGTFTMLDIPPTYYSAHPYSKLLKEFT